MRNPIRRSRNIGKTQGGRVKDGRAREKWDRVFTQDVWTRLSEGDEKWQILTENPSRWYYHPCSGEEYVGVLARLPEDLTSEVKTIILRRKSKLDEKLGVEARQRYYCMIMNALPISNEYVWRMRPEDSTFRHFEPWCDDWREEDGFWKLCWQVDETRRYYLYHVFLHEVGNINQPAFHSLRRREEFAENFA